MTFTLACDFRAIDGSQSSRITYLEVITSKQIGDGPVVYEKKSGYAVTGGMLNLSLPASATPTGYHFVVRAPQQDLVWLVPPQADGSTVNLSAYADLGSSGGSSDGSGIVPITSANSGTAYTVAAPDHGEKRHKLTLTGNAVLTLSGGTAGEVCAVQLVLIQDATAGRTVTWPGNISWGAGGPPVLSSATGKADMVYLTTTDGGSSWEGALIGVGYTSPIPPSAPTSVAAIVTGGNVVLNWTQGAANGSTVVQNKIYRGTTSGSLTLLTTIAAGTTYTDTGPFGSGTYYYKVSAVNALGESAQSTQVSAVPSLVVIAADDFNRADATASSPTNGLIGQTTPTGAKTWLNFSGSGAWSVSSNGVVATAGLKFAGIDAGVANCSVRGRVACTGAAGDHGLVARWVDANNFITAFMDPGGYYIQKTVGGAVTNVNSGGGAIPAGTTAYLELALNGNNVTLFADGIQVATATITDTALQSGTKHGFTTGGGTSVKFDDFQVTVP